MLETSYSKNAANARRERRDMLKALSVLSENCGNCAFYEGWLRGTGYCTHHKNASTHAVDYTRVLVPAKVTVTQGCELFDKHKVEIREPDKAVEAEMEEIQRKYGARRDIA